jgi:hypothetical protein
MALCNFRTAQLLGLWMAFPSAACQKPEPREIELRLTAAPLASTSSARASHQPTCDTDACRRANVAQPDGSAPPDARQAGVSRLQSPDLTTADLLKLLADWHIWDRAHYEPIARALEEHLARSPEHAGLRSGAEWARTAYLGQLVASSSAGNGRCQEDGDLRGLKAGELKQYAEWAEPARIASVQLLGCLPDATAAALLDNGYNDRSGRVRTATTAAVQARLARSSQLFTKALAAIAGRLDDPSGARRGQAIDALETHTQSPQVRALLARRLLNDTDLWVRHRAQSALSGAPWTVDELVQLFGNYRSWRWRVEDNTGSLVEVSTEGKVFALNLFSDYMASKRIQARVMASFYDSNVDLREAAWSAAHGPGPSSEWERTHGPPGYVRLSNYLGVADLLWHRARSADNADELLSALFWQASQSGGAQARLAVLRLVHDPTCRAEVLAELERFPESWSAAGVLDVLGRYASWPPDDRRTVVRMLRHYLELPSARQLAAAAIGDRAQDVRKEAIALLDHHAWPAEQLSRYLNQILSGSPTDEDLAQLKATVAGSSTRALAELSERIDALIARRAAVSGANQRPSGR